MSGIFISYRHIGGYTVANHLTDRLKKDGYNVLIDKTILKAGEFHTGILKAIEACDDFIVVLNGDVFSSSPLNTSNIWTISTSIAETVYNPILSSSSNETDWLIKEIEYAKQLNKNIIPVVLSGFEWPSELPTNLNWLKDFNPIKYGTDDDFKHFYNDKLLVFLHSPHPTQPIHPIKKNHIGIIMTIIIVIGVCFCFYIFQKPVLLLVGGGSVKGFLEEKNIPISTSKKWVYLPISTGAALPIISKEIDVKRNIGNGKLRQFDLVVFSAMEATDDDFISDSSTRNKFINDIGYVIGVKIGSNDLKIVLKKDDYFKKYFDNDNLITPKDLADIVQDTNVIVFTTSNNRGNRGVSGTFEKYKEILKTQNVYLDSIYCEEFNLNQQYGSFNNDKNPFVVLGTSTFLVDTVNDPDEWSTFPFYDIDKQTKLKNDLYVYFVANPKPNENGYYVSSKKVRKFLKRIGINLPKQITTNNSNMLIQKYTMDGKHDKE